MCRKKGAVRTVCGSWRTRMCELPKAKSTPWKSRMLVTLKETFPRGMPSKMRGLQAGAGNDGDLQAVGQGRHGLNQRTRQPRGPSRDLRGACKPTPWESAFGWFPTGSPQQPRKNHKQHKQNRPSAILPTASRAFWNPLSFYELQNPSLQNRSNESTLWRGCEDKTSGVRSTCYGAYAPDQSADASVPAHGDLSPTDVWGVLVTCLDDFPSFQLK